MTNENSVNTDVLVIGGGMAGLFAAIKAAEQGARVTLVDKGYAGRSGSSACAAFFAVFNPAWGHDLDAWMKVVNTIGEYVNNREWTETVFRESHDRFLDLLSWGVEFQKDEQGEININRFEGIPTESLLLEHRVFGGVIRKQALKVGVKIVDRFMVTDLLQDDGRVVGAMGMAVDSYDLCAFHARATIMCTGASSFKPSGWPVSELTGDGHIMAYQAGAAISGAEFNEMKSTNAEFPAVCVSMSRFLAEKGKSGAHTKVHHRLPPQLQPIKGINAEGEEVHGLVGSNFMELEFEVHAGRAPLHSPNSPVVRTGGAAAGLSVHSSEGVWPSDSNCATELPGLYVAGDSCCSMQCGAVYPGVGYALAGAAVTGARAGSAAGEYARQASRPSMDESRLTALESAILGPAQRTGGFGPRWVTRMLQNVMVPYYVLYVKNTERLTAALTFVEFMRDHLVPMLRATDPHELRLAHETKNMVRMAEAKLRASLYRTESRGTHYREDFPHRDDPTWLVWVLLHEENGEMKTFKKPVPKEWWPDLALPYKERYLNPYPGE